MRSCQTYGERILYQCTRRQPLIESEDILAILETARSQKTSVINGMCPIKEEKDFRVLMFLRLFLLQMVIFFT